jgi:hypothetical protein
MTGSFLDTLAKETEEHWCNVDLFEARTRTFILRVWLEAREIRDVDPKWRGVIEHIPSGERHYFHKIEDLPKLILPYLSEPEKDLTQSKSIGQRLITHDQNAAQDNSNNIAQVSQSSAQGSDIDSWLSRLQEWWQKHHS